MNACFEKEKENIIQEDTQIAAFQVRNKTKSKLLNYSYFTIFAPLITQGSQESGVGSQEITESSHFLLRTS
jgi:hypothetical protein